MKDGVTPILQKDRPAPYLLTADVDQAYQKLVKDGLMFPVIRNKWAAPVVHDKKPSGEIRVCGDYKALNEVIEDDHYKMPNIEDLFAELALEGNLPDMFTVLDLTKAYNSLRTGLVERHLRRFVYRFDPSEDWSDYAFDCVTFV